MSEKPHLFRNGIWYTLLCSVVSLFLIFKLSPGFSLRLSLTQIHWGYILLGFPALFLVWLAKAYRMFVITQGMGIEIELAAFLKIYLATCFISHVTPFSSGGTPLQIYLIRKKGVPLGKATAITAVDLGLHSIFFLLLIPFTLIFNLNLLPDRLAWSELGQVAKWVSFLLLLLLLFYLLLKQHWIFRWCARIKWLRQLWHAGAHARARFVVKHDWLKNLRHEWELFREGWLILVRQNPASIGWAILGTAVYFLFYFLLAPLVVWALGRPASFWGMMGRQLLYNFGQILIPTPGGSGGSEFLLTYLFKGLTGDFYIGPFVFFWKLYTFYCTLTAGGFYFFKLMKAPVENRLS